MTTPAKALSLTILILALVAGVWGMGYLWNNYSEQGIVISEQPKSAAVVSGASSSTKLIIDTTSTPAGRLFIEGQATGL
ncbi:MAG: hypothetical protein WC750_00690 [Patescibacteria group bacterium]|jgi:hypothetical protein